MDSVRYIRERTAARKALGLIPSVYPVNGKNPNNEQRDKYTILIGKCIVKPNCPYTWVLKFEGEEIERGEENTRELAMKDAIDARTSHQTHNQT